MFKRYTLAALSIGAVSVQAQMVHYRNDAPARAENEAIVPWLTPVKPLPSGSAKALSVIPLGGAANIYTFLLGGQNQVCYNPDINTVIFQHRQDPADNGNIGTSGALRVDHSTDGGATWTIDDPMITPVMLAGNAPAVGCRYPNATLYNPAGNTDPANAFIVSHGPALSASTGAKIWGWLVQASCKLDGDYATDTYVDHYGDTSSFHPYGLVSNPNGDVWSISTRYLTASNPINYSTFNLNKAVFNNGTNSFDWTVSNTIDPDFYLDSDGLPLYVSHNIAFGPDGLTGYAMIIGKENDGLPQGPAPLLWKTTDGGSSWNQLPTHDFSVDQPYLDNLTYTDDSGLPRPWFSEADLVVDHNGAVHIIAEVLSGFSASPDSQGFVYSAYDTQFLFHCSTSNGTAWSSRLVDNVHGDDVDIPSSDPNNIPTQTIRPQASRSADGTRVFFTWNSSGPNEVENFIPDVWAAGYNVDAQLGTNPKNLTFGSDVEGSCWLQTISPVSISNGSEHQYEIPVVVAEHNGDALAHADFFYLKGVGFDDSEFVVGVAEATAPLEISIQPNPVTGPFTLSGKDLMGSQLLLTDALGRPVFQATANTPQYILDLSDAAAGPYLLRVQGEQGERTLRVVKQ